MSSFQFLSTESASRIREQFGTPCYVYHEATLRASARTALEFPNAFGLTVRYAMKASPNRNLLRLFHSMGLHIDASSGHEVRRAMEAGIPAEHISLSSQELPEDFEELINMGMSLNACSLYQLERYGEAFPNSKVGLRFNPGLGSGGTQRTNVGGPASSFGIWFRRVEETAAILEKHGLEAFRVHSHIGSGSDPEVWVRAVSLTLDLAFQFPSVTTVNLGGGYKVARMPNEVATDLQKIGVPMRQEFEIFAEKTGRRLKLEVEPGTFLTANGCILLSTVQDLGSTGRSGYEFIKLDTGMTENLRPAMYGAQHPMEVLAEDAGDRPSKSYVVVGHCCESGDIFTPAPGDAEALAPRTLREAKIGDLFAVGGAGAYTSGMSAKHYNSFPEAPEVMIREDGSLALMRSRQPLEQIWANEVDAGF